MKQFFAIFLLFYSPALFSQNDTVWYFGANGKIGSEDENVKVRMEVDFKSKKKAVVQSYHFNHGKWKNTVTEKYFETGDNSYRIKYSSGEDRHVIIRRFSQVENGIYNFAETINDIIRRKGHTKSKIPLILHGEVTEYYSNGQKKSVSVFKANELISNKNWLEDGSEYFDNIFYSVDEEPRFAPGTGYLHQHILNTFEDAQVDISSLSGSIIIGFTVFENGQVGGFRVVDGLHNRLDEIAMKAFRTLFGEWSPARLNDKPVRYFQLFPINFIHHEQKFDFLQFDGGVIHWDVN